jgi:hypothetical protein
VKNDEEVYMQWRNLQQQISERIEVYYGRLLKLANNLQVKATDVFLIIIFIVYFHPYFILATIGLVRNTLIKHKENAIISEESGSIIINYNALITHPRLLGPIIHLDQSCTPDYLLPKTMFIC